MLREQLAEALAEAGRNRDVVGVATIRLILAAIRDRDVCGRGRGESAGIDDDEIEDMLRTMVRQRRETIEDYVQAGRCAAAEQERDEIAVIERFLPRPMDEAEMDTAIEHIIHETGACCFRDIGRTMAELRERFSGRMDFTKACGRVRERLA